MKRRMSVTSTTQENRSTDRVCPRSPIRLRSRKALFAPQAAEQDQQSSCSVSESPLPAKLAKTSEIEKKDVKSGADHGIRISVTSQPQDGFVSCLKVSDEVSSPCGTNLTHLLKRAISVEEIHDTSWLSSNMIDLVISQFAKWYPEVDFLSIDFVPLALNPNNHDNFQNATDILGRKLKYDSRRPIVLLCNSGNIHWTLIRVMFRPKPELQLFEPMGKPPNRTGQLSFRYVPRNVIKWLDTCCPLSCARTWLSVTTSAITTQHQYTSFDCGVACLLYAEKCGLGEDKETINSSTTQQDITLYRGYLQEFIKRMKAS